MAPPTLHRDQNAQEAAIGRTLIRRGTTLESAVRRAENDAAVFRNGGRRIRDSALARLGVPVRPSSVPEGAIPSRFRAGRPNQVWHPKYLITGNPAHRKMVQRDTALKWFNNHGSNFNPSQHAAYRAILTGSHPDELNVQRADNKLLGKRKDGEASGAHGVEFGPQQNHPMTEAPAHMQRREARQHLGRRRGSEDRAIEFGSQSNRRRVNPEEDDDGEQKEAEAHDMAVGPGDDGLNGILGMLDAGSQSDAPQYADAGVGSDALHYADAGVGPDAPHNADAGIQHSPQQSDFSQQADIPQEALLEAIEVLGLPEVPRHIPGTRLIQMAMDEMDAMGVPSHDPNRQWKRRLFERALEEMDEVRVPTRPLLPEPAIHADASTQSDPIPPQRPQLGVARGDSVDIAPTRPQLGVARGDSHNIAPRGRRQLGSSGIVASQSIDPVEAPVRPALSAAAGPQHSIDAVERQHASAAAQTEPPAAPRLAASAVASSSIPPSAPQLSAQRVPTESVYPSSQYLGNQITVAQLQDRRRARRVVPAVVLDQPAMAAVPVAAASGRGKLRRAPATRDASKPVVSAAGDVYARQNRMQPGAQSYAGADNQRPIGSDSVEADHGIQDPEAKYAGIPVQQLELLLERGLLPPGELMVLTGLVKKMRQEEAAFDPRKSIEELLNPDEPNPILRAGRSFAQAQQGIDPSQIKHRVRDVFETGFRRREDTYDNPIIRNQQRSDQYTLEGTPDMNTLMYKTAAEDLKSQRAYARMAHDTTRAFIGQSMEDRSVFAEATRNRPTRYDDLVYQNRPSTRVDSSVHDTEVSWADSDWMAAMFKR